MTGVFDAKQPKTEIPPILPRPDTNSVAESICPSEIDGRNPSSFRRWEQVVALAPVEA